MTNGTAPNFQPTLTGETVLIRPLRADDFEEMYAAAADPLIWEVHPVPNRHERSVFRAFFEQGLATGSAFAICDLTHRAIIGTSRYGGYDRALSEIEIGWTFIAREYWGGATNAEMKRLLIEHAFTFVDCVTFQVGEHNMRSRGAMLKIGGVLRPDILNVNLNGHVVRHVVYEIRKGNA